MLLYGQPGSKTQVLSYTNCDAFTAWQSQHFDASLTNLS
jgi:hypothetical protein